MGRRFALTLGILAVCGLTSPARADEEVVYVTAGRGATPMVLQPLATGDRAPTALFAEGPLLVGEPGAGQPLENSNILRVDIGFLYLQPYFSDRAVTLAVPTAGGSFLLGDTGNITHNFALAPRLGLDYLMRDLGVGIGASAQFLSITGNLERTLNSTAGTGLLNVQSNVDLVTATFLEGSKLITLDRWQCFQDKFLEDCSLLVTLGGRYAYVSQNYSASLTSGPNVGALSATQSFNGLGLTSSLGGLCPLVRDFYLYSNVRGSILVGPNDRSTSVTVVAPGNPAATSATVVTENKTDFIGVGEFEVGFGWGWAVRRNSAVSASQTGTLLWFRLGWVGQVWGDLGLLSATGQPQDFSSGSLFLQGFSLLAGIDY
jgi:hypothetical protein